MLVGKESISFGLLLVSFGFFLFFYIITTLLSISVLLAATWIYLKATINIDEIKEIKKNNSTPIILLTAKGEAKDRIQGLEFGADDYLGKPFEPKELLLRINNILNKTPVSYTHLTLPTNREV